LFVVNPKKLGHFTSKYGKEKNQDTQKYFLKKA